MPAQLIITSILPKVASAFSIADFTESSFDTSTLKPATLKPCLVNSETAFANKSSLISNKATLPPSLEIKLAIPFPKPSAPPETTAT